MAKCILRIYKHSLHEEENKPSAKLATVYVCICEEINTGGKVVQLVVPPLIT